MTPTQAIAAKVKGNNLQEPDPNAVPENNIPNEEEETMANVEPTPVEMPTTAEQTVSIPLSGISALIAALTDTQKNLMAFKFHDITAGEMTEFLTNISNIQQCVQYLGDVVKANYGQNL